MATALEPARTTIRLAIVEDHPVVREGTAALLAAQPWISVEGTAGSLAEARELLRHAAVDVVLLDIRLGNESGLDLLADADRAIVPAVVVLTAFDYPQYADAARRMGAAGFVLKTAPLADLVAAIHLAASDARPIPIQLAVSARDYPTARELEVVHLVVEGRSNDEIATALRIGSRTVETHLRRLYERFSVGSRTELATRALREGWLEIPPA